MTGGKGRPRAFLSTSLELDCPLGRTNPEEINTESEHEYEEQGCAFISMNYKRNSVHTKQAVDRYNPFSTAVKNQTRTAEK